MEKPRLGVLQELIEARKENNAVRTSNSSLQAELEKYKSQVNVLSSHSHALESNCSAAVESKIVTSKVCMCIVAVRSS